MANAPLDTGTPQGPRLRDRGGVFAWVARVDDTVYAAERVAVTGALLTMSFLVSLAIFYQLLTRLRATWQAIGEGDTTWVALWPAPVLLLVVFMMGRAIGLRSPGFSAAPQLAPVFGLGLAAALATLSAMMLALPSQLVCGVLIVLVGAVVAVLQLDTAVPIGDPRGAMVVRTRVTSAPRTVRTSSSDTFSWQLPNRSTHRTSHESPPFSSRGIGTTPGNNIPESMGVPRSNRSMPLHRAAATGASTSRAANVDPGELR